jgi:hypothetical protein
MLGNFFNDVQGLFPNIEGIVKNLNFRTLDLWKIISAQIIFDAGNFMVVRNRCDRGVKQFSQRAQRFFI